MKCGDSLPDEAWKRQTHTVNRATGYLEPQTRVRATPINIAKTSGHA